MNIKKTWLLMLLLFSNSSYAVGQLEAAKVTGIYCGIFSGLNMCSIYFDKTVSGSPTCSSQNQRMQISADTKIGQAMLSLALTANSTGNSVRVTGTGNCSIWSDTEDMNMLFMSPPN